MALNKPNLNTDLIAKESTVEEIKLSTESIKAVADEILSRMGLTNDTGGVLLQGVSLLNSTLCSALAEAVA